MTVIGCNIYKAFKNFSSPHIVSLYFPTDWLCLLFVSVRLLSSEQTLESQPGGPLLKPS